MAEQTSASLFVSPLEIVQHLWKRRFWFLLAPPVVLVLAYLFVRFFVPEVYEAQASVLVRERPAFYREERRPAGIDPPAYKDLLLTDGLLYDVVQAAREKFPALADKKFESLKQNFEIKTTTTRDTSVSIAYSPVLTMSAEFGDPQVVHFIVQKWLELGMKRYGSVLTREAQSVDRAVEERSEELEERTKRLGAREGELTSRLQQINTRIAGKIRLLTTAPYDVSALTDVARTYPSEFDTRAPYNPTILNVAPAETPGLWERRIDLQLELAALNADENDAEAAKIQSKIDLIDEQAEELEKEILGLTNDLGLIKAELTDVRATLYQANTSLNILSMMAGYAAADQALAPTDEETFGDLRILSHPIVPEKRIFPPRTVIALAVTIVFSLLLLFFVTTELYLKRALAVKVTR